MKAKTFNYKKNHILYKEGEHIEGNSIFLIIKGKAEKIPEGGGSMLLA